MRIKYVNWLADAIVWGSAMMIASGAGLWLAEIFQH